MDRKWWTLLVVCAATFMLLLDVTIVVVALPTIQKGLHTSFSGVQWVVDAYALTLASVLLTAGSLADRYGRKLLFTIGLIVFTLGSLLCGVAQSSLMLILSRSAQGIGGAILFATSLALLAQSFQGKDRGVAFGAWGAVTGVATGLGPVLGGVITTGISWRGIFLVNLPIGVAALAITRWRVEESRTPHAARPDWAGFAALTAGLVSLVYGLIRAGEIAWSDSGVIVLFVLAALFLVAFVAVERRARYPMFDLSLFKIPTFDGGLASAFAMNGSLFAMFLYLVLYLQDDLGYSALGTGVRLLVITAGTLVAATVSGRLSSQVPVRWLIGPGLVLVGVGLLLMTGLDSTTPWTHLVPGFIVAGVGSGMVNPPLASTAVGVVEPQRSGMASGVNTTFRQIGIATGIAAYGSIFANSLHNDLAQRLSAVPGLAGHTAQVASAVQQGAVGPAIQASPPESRGALVEAIRSSFTSSLDVLLVVSAVLALVGAVCALGLIRSRDFVASQPSPATSVEEKSDPGSLDPASR
jgi:EmrB/QacA subfamily drug resistance transporter